jgi:hypothetical protein
MHLNDGELRTFLDNADDERMAAHLADCERCQERFGQLSSRAATVGHHLASLSAESQSPSPAAYARLQKRIRQKENQSMFDKIFSRQYRFAWAALGAVLILGVALAFPGVRAIANGFLGLFRVQQFTVVQVNSDDLPEQMESLSQFEAMLSNQVQIEELGEPQEASSAEEASGLAGIPVRLPATSGEPQELMVQPGAKASLEVDLALAQAVLDEMGHADLQLPANLDGATITVEVPAGVAASYGECSFDLQTAREDGFDPDSPQAALRNCTTLVQMPSPTISAPPGLDIARIGEVFLQLTGMSPEEAAQFSQTVDWTTTLVIPIPERGTTYQDVSVDGAAGTLITHRNEYRAQEYLLVWVKNEIVYALSGPGDGQEGLALADSLQ